MTYAFPAYLYALPAMAIPVILYLLFRRKRRDVPWGAIYILRKVIETRSKTTAWLQYLIIALRILALAALIMVFAAPHQAWTPPTDGSFPEAPRATHRLILLDTSASMTARVEGGTALDRALSLSRRLIASCVAPGQVDLLPLDGRDKTIAFNQLPVSESNLEEVIAECASTDGSAQVRRGLQKALDLFRASPWQRRELYLLSDFRAADFGEGQEGELARILKALAEMGVTVHGVRFASTETSNFALRSMAPAVDTLLANQPSLFRIEVGAYPTGANTDEQESILTLSCGDKILAEEIVALHSGTKTLTLPVKLPAGRHTLTARLRGDALNEDNELQRSYSVLPELRAIVVQNIVTEKGFDNPRNWLENALTNPPKQGSRRQQKHSSAAEAYAAHSQKVAQDRQTGRSNALHDLFSLSLEGKIPEQLSTELLQDAHMVILLDVDRLPVEILPALRRYVLRGGTLFLAPGPKTTRADFNKTFTSLAPSLLTTLRYDATKTDRYEQCLVEDSTHPLWQALESPQHGNLASARFYNYFNLSPSGAEQGSTTLLRLSDGAPLLQTRQLGRGRVHLWTAGLGGDWHSLVVHPGYPVLLIRLLQEGAARNAWPNNLAKGQPLLLASEGAQAKIIRPDGTSEIIAASMIDGRPFLRYDRTDTAGTYDIRFDLQSEKEGLLFHVISASSESDLRPLAADDEAALASTFAGSIQSTEVDLVQTVGESYGGPSLAILCGLAALVCFLLEAGLTRRVFL